MMTTSLVLWRRENPLPTAAKAPEKQEEAKPASEAPFALEVTKDRALARRSVPEKTAPSPQAKGEIPLQAAPAPRAHALPGPSLPAPDLSLKAEAAPERLAERKKQLAERPQASAVVEVVANHAAMDKTETATAVSRETLESLPANRAVSGGAALSPGVAAGNLQPLGKASAKRDRAGSVPAPVHVLEHLANGTLRLTVKWSSERTLYLLKRSASSIVALSPLSSTSDGLGVMSSTFEFRVGPKEHVDLYHLPKPVLDPKSLPEEGPVEGVRIRVL